MKRRLTRILGLALCCTSLLAATPAAGQDHPARQLYETGRQLFDRKAYAAAVGPLTAFVRQNASLQNPPADQGAQAEAAYMLACAAYELRDPHARRQLADYLERYPDTPHANRIEALLASACFFAEDYAGALEHFGQADLALLPDAERDDMTYRMALSHLKTGHIQEAAIWFETLGNLSDRYAADCDYYLSYIRYTQGKLDEALKGFLALQPVRKYAELVPYYIGEIYLQKKHYDKAEIIAQNYLSAHPDAPHAGEMHRLQGSADYHFGRYLKAMEAFRRYRESPSGSTQPRRDALYMQGLSCYACQVYSEVPEILGQVAKSDDVLAQSAWLHMGLAYVQMDDKRKARLAFEQAAALDADRKLKEQAAYNHALCIHETAYSAFGESVRVFEDFLNEFPDSPYAAQASQYLVEVYMNTRNYDVALASINRIAHPTPTLIEAKARLLFQLGTQHFAQAEFGQALDYFAQAESQYARLGSSQAARRYEAVYWHGETLYRMNRMNEAEADFDRYRNQTPQRDTQTYALAHYNLGYIAFHRQDFQQAARRFDTFLQTEKAQNAPLLADACNRMGDCLMHSRQFDRAKTYYQRAESLNTAQSDYAYYQLAQVAGLQKDYQGKVALLDQMADKFPESPYTVNALYEKGRAYVQAGDNAQAIATFSQLASQHPSTPAGRKAAAEVGLLYYRGGQYDKAIDAYKQVVTRYPGSEEARLAMQDMKSLYVDANRVDEYAKLLEQLPGHARLETSEQDSLTYRAAEKQLLSGRKKEAGTALRRYLDSYPDGAFALDAHYQLAVMAQENKDQDGILTHTARLLAYPESPYTEEALTMRAAVLVDRKQYAQALADYKQLQDRATTAERRQTASAGALRCAVLTADDAETIAAAQALLAEAKLPPELRNEALYQRAKACLRRHDTTQAMADFKLLAQDTRTVYGAEAKYQVAQLMYDAADYAAAEKEILNYIDQSTPHAYWLARSFVLLSDVYVAMGKTLDARQYLLSLQQNYQADDDIAGMIELRLKQLDETGTDTGNTHSESPKQNDEQ